MARFLHENWQAAQRKWPTAFLAFFWCLGLLSGFALYIQSGDFIASLMRMAASSHVSIVSLMISNLLPFALSAFAVYIHMPELLYGFAFCKACLFMFLAIGTLTAFGSAGWLIRSLLCFSDICLTGLIYLYWQRHISGMRRFSTVYSGVFAALALLIGSFDYAYIAPFLAQLINN